VECGEYEYKGTKTEENRGQEFLTGKQLRNLWCRRCLEVWKQRKSRGESKMECAKCGREDTIIGRKMSKEEKGKVLCPECRTGKRKPWWNWEVVAWPTAQQSNAWIGALKSTAKERGSQREVRRTFKMLREV